MALSTLALFQCNDLVAQIMEILHREDPGLPGLGGFFVSLYFLYC